jgi:hypothetical protein
MCWRVCVVLCWFRITFVSGLNCGLYLVHGRLLGLPDVYTRLSLPRTSICCTLLLCATKPVQDKPSKLFHLVLSHALFSSTCTLLHFMILSLHKATFLRGIIVGRTCSARFIINSVFVNDLSNLNILQVSNPSCLWTCITLLGCTQQGTVLGATSPWAHHEHST